MLKTKTSCIALALLIGCSSVWAERGGKHGRDDDRYEERDDRKGGGRGRHDDNDRYRYDDRRSRDGGNLSIDIRFGDSDRRYIHDYYGSQFRSGNCPPGLAKKGNGCMPPGQAKKWRRGYALPHDVARYPLPHDLLRRLPPPPRGHEYVRVAGDILMIAIGSAMVVDAIEDLTR